MALALWNGKDPILKERMFGLTNSEGNHGEDVKEYYFYVDNTPTHSYMRYLYKYPHAAYPYDDLVSTNRTRSKTELEYELIDTGIFDEDRYFDVEVEYAKADPEDILMSVTVHNRGPDARRDPCSSDDLVSQHVVGRTHRAPFAPVGPSREDPRQAPRTRATGSSQRRRRRRGSSQRTRPTQPGSSAAKISPPLSRMEYTTS